MKRAYTVAIVGGGPAGATCAYELGKAGVDTVLFDHSHPREKPCGGGVTNKIKREFKIPQKEIETNCDYVILEMPDGRRIEAYSKDCCSLVMRKKFDEYLLKKAAKVSKFHAEKVTKIESRSSKWIVSTKKRKIVCDVLVGADGVNSLVRKTTNQQIPKEELGLCVIAHLPHKKAHISKHFKKSIELYFEDFSSGVGYSWIFPKLDMVSIGVGSKLGTLGLREKLKSLMERHEKIERFKLRKNEKLLAHMLPIVTNPKFYDLPTSGKNWVLIGDAAGHVNAINGEGIYYSMCGGKLAAKAINEGNIAKYEEYWRDTFGSDLYIAAKLQKIMYNRKLLNLIGRLAQKSPELRKLMVEIILAEKDYSKVFSLSLVSRSLKILKEQIIKP